MAVSTIYWIGVLRVFRIVLVGFLLYALINGIVGRGIAVSKGIEIDVARWRKPLLILIAIIVIFIPNTEVFYSMFY